MALGERSGGVIVNADSAQIYRDLPILSAAPSPAERARVGHRLYGDRDGSDPCSAADWAALAKAEIAGLHEEGKLPILVGGTGLYLRTLLDGIAPVPPIDPQIRAQVRAASVGENVAALTTLDPVAAATLNPGDTTRIAGSARTLSEFGTARGRTRELKQLVAAAMPVTSVDAPARNALLQAAAILHFRSGELDSAEALASDALVAATAAGDEAGQRSMLNTRALALKDLGRYEEAERHAGEALQRSRAAGAESEIASHANTCAILAKMRGDNAHAAALYEEAITLHRRSGEQRGLATCLNNLGNVHRALGDSAGAQRCFEEALRACEQHGIASTRSFALINLAIVHQQAGRMALATSFAQRARAEPAATMRAGDTMGSLTTALDSRAMGRTTAVPARATMDAATSARVDLSAAGRNIPARAQARALVTAAVAAKAVITVRVAGASPMVRVSSTDSIVARVPRTISAAMSA